MHEGKKTPVPSNAGYDQSFVGMLNFISWGSKFIKKNQTKIIGSF